MGWDSYETSSIRGGGHYQIPNFYKIGSKNSIPLRGLGIGKTIQKAPYQVGHKIYLHIEQENTYLEAQKEE